MKNGRESEVWPKRVEPKHGGEKKGKDVSQNKQPAQKTSAAHFLFLQLSRSHLMHALALTHALLSQLRRVKHTFCFTQTAAAQFFLSPQCLFLTPAAAAAAAATAAAAAAATAAAAAKALHRLHSLLHSFEELEILDI